MWLLFSLVAFFLWGIVSTVDKIIIEKFLENHQLYIIFIGVFGLMTLLVIPFKSFYIPTLKICVLTILAGMFYIYGVFFYIKAISIEEVSRVIPLYQLRPIFVLLFAILTVGENIQGNDWAAISLLIFGSFLISLKNLKNLKTLFNIRKAFFIMLIVDIILALYYVISKYVLQFQSFLNAFLIMRIGACLASVSFLTMKRYREDFIKFFKSENGKPLAIIGINQSVNLVAIGFITYAISLGSVSIINSLNGFHSIFVLIFTIFLSIKYPDILKEKISKKNVFLKTISILIMFFGLFLLYL